MKSYKQSIDATLLILERAMGIEPTSEAWEASILPLYDARSPTKLAKQLLARKHHAAVRISTHGHTPLPRLT